MVATPSQFVDAQGGASALARRLGAKPGTVQLWKHREKIPRDAWPELLTNIPGLTLATLLDVEAAGDEARKQVEA